jgi:hypothetical protein
MQRYVFVQLLPKDLACFSKKLIPTPLAADFMALSIHSRLHQGFSILTILPENIPNHSSQLLAFQSFLIRRSTWPAQSQAHPFANNPMPALPK